LDKELEKGKTAVLIPSDLYEQIRDSVSEKGFSSVDDYVAYVLRVSEGKVSQGNAEEDDERVKNRLKALGYI